MALAIQLNNSRFFPGVQVAHSAIFRMKPRFNCSWNPAGFLYSVRHTLCHAFIQSLRRFCSHIIDSLHPSANSNTLCRSMNSAFSMYFLQLIFMAPLLKVCPLLNSSPGRFPRLHLCSAPQRLALPQLLTAQNQCAEVVRPAHRRLYRRALPRFRASAKMFFTKGF